MGQWATRIVEDDDISLAPDWRVVTRLSGVGRAVDGNVEDVEFKWVAVDEM